MKKRIITLAFLITTVALPAMEDPSKEMAELWATYTKPLSESLSVNNLFSKIPIQIIKIQKRLLTRLFVQAMQDQNFSAAHFGNLLDDSKLAVIGTNESEQAIESYHAQEFRDLLCFIPWDGKTSVENGNMFSVAVLLSKKITEIGFCPDYSSYA